METEEERIAEAKREARQRAREIRDGMTPAEIAEASRQITQKVLALPQFREARVIMSYVSMEREPDTREILRAAMAAGKRVLIPRCLDREHMEAVPFEGFEKLRPGRMGILEPADDRNKVGGGKKDEADLAEGATEERTLEPELILVPCVAATRDGKRLGHGAGYYDRFLAGRPGKRVCLCFGKLLMDDLPVGERDERMDLVITEDQEERT